MMHDGCLLNRRGVNMNNNKFETLKELSLEQMSVLESHFNWFICKWLDEKRKKNLVENLPEEDRDFLTQVLFLPRITEKRLIYLSEKKEFNEIKNTLIEVKNGNAGRINDVIKIYESNLQSAKHSYEEKIQEYKLKKLPKSKRTQADNLLKKSLKDKLKVLIDDYYSKHSDIIEDIDKYYKTFLYYTSIINLKIFSPQVLSLNEQMIVQIANVVYDPSYLVIPELDMILEGREEIVSQWYFSRKMSISDYKEFCEKINSKDTWKKQYLCAKKSIEKNMEAPIYPIMERKVIIRELLDNISDKRLNSAMIVLFSLIEGLLWDFSCEVNQIEKVYVKKGVIYDYINNCNFESTRIRDVLQRSAVREHLDDDFLHEFCNELYEERNLVLHGNKICFDNCESNFVCLIQKIFVLDYILNSLIEVYEKILFKILDENFTEDRIQNLLKSLEK